MLDTLTTAGTEQRERDLAGEQELFETPLERKRDFLRTANDREKRAVTGIP